MAVIWRILREIATDFVNGAASKSKRYFYASDISGIPEGKMVVVIFKYVDEDLDE